MQVENKNSEKCLANYVALNPVSFLRRTAEVFPDRVSLVYEEKSYTWSETFERCKRLGKLCEAGGRPSPERLVEL